MPLRWSSALSFATLSRARTTGWPVETRTGSSSAIALVGSSALVTFHSLSIAGAVVVGAVLALVMLVMTPLAYGQFVAWILG